MLILYALPVSGYCSKVRSVLRLKDIAYEERTPPGGSYSSPEYRSHMPPGTIPAIEHIRSGASFKLFDSEAIVEYLNELVPDPPLLAGDLEVRAHQRALCQFHSGRLEPAVRALFPVVKQQQTDLVDGAAERFEAQLVMLERVAIPGMWLGGDALSLVDCSFPFSIHMGCDIFARMGHEISLSGRLTDYLGKLDATPVLSEEIAANREAVDQWLNQFLPGDS